MRHRSHTERDARICARWKEGYSSGIIAAEFGISRSAVIGVAHRNGLSRQGAVTKVRKHIPLHIRQDAARKAVRARVAKQRAAKSAIIPAYEPEEAPSARKRERLPDRPKSYYRELLAQAVRNTVSADG